MDGCANVHLDATKHEYTLVFVHTLKDGPVDRSYGLKIAALAGIPKAAITEARGRFATMKAALRQRENPSVPPPQLGLFAAENPVLEKLRNLDAENVTPKQVLDLLYELKKKLWASFPPTRTNEAVITDNL